MSPRILTDEIDEKIIAALREDGRMTNRALARAVGVPESATRKRLRRLLESGACSYGLVVDIEVTGLRAFGWLSLSVQPACVEAVFRHIAELDVSALCARTSGPFNLVAYLYGRDLPDVARRIEAIAALKGVRRTQFRPVVSHPAHRHEFVALSDFRSPVFWHLEDEA